MPSHYVRLNAATLLESSRSSLAENSLGRFLYNSIEDLESNRPSSFDRALFTPDRRGSEASGFLSVSDSWRAKPMLRVLYGARLEGNRFVDAPDRNPLVAGVFGEPNDRIPNSLHVSPRIGFTLRLTDDGGGYGVGPLGTFRVTTLRYLSGGIGEFRNALPVNLLSSAISNTGLPDGSSAIHCVGAAVPVPNWGAYSSESAIPSQCTGNSPGQSILNDAAPRVELFSSNYSADRSWRANLAYGSKYRAIRYTIDGNYSLGLSLPEYVNLNFAGIPRFTTIDGRSVFVSKAAIDSRTGALSPVESRLNSNFGSVVSRQSTGKSRTGQISLGLVPKLPSNSYRLSGSYTLSASRSTFNGFVSPTFVSPLDRETTRSSFDSRHQIRIEAGALYRGFSFTMFARLQSGLPFTPVINGDVNGDGIANDRAFIADPSAQIGNTAVSGFSSLLERAPARIRKCLEPHFGSVAARNSCEGPWISAMTAQITTYRELPLLHQRGKIALAFANPLGGIDRVLHGPNSQHGWGSNAAPDPALYIVRGFDPAASKFIYDVNPGFGRARPSDIAGRSPFRVTLDISFDVGKPFSVQQVERFLGPGRNGKAGPKLTAVDLKKRYQRTVSDPYRALLEESDSLLLTREQAEAITAEDTKYRRGWTASGQQLPKNSRLCQTTSIRSWRCACRKMRRTRRGSTRDSAFTRRLQDSLVRFK